MYKVAIPVAALLGAGLNLAAGGVAVAAEGDPRIDLGVRANIVGGTGKPSNDILGAGLVGHYRLSSRWAVGLSIDHSAEFDVERAPDLVGLTSPEVIDAVGTSTALTGSLERAFGRPAGRWEWFVSAGVGINSVDVDDVSGPLIDGGTFDISTDAGTELLALAGVGGRRWLGNKWGVEAQVRAERRFADWQMVDRVSGATGTIDDYSVRGILLTVLRRF
ncbi:MAG: hypothetical protein ACRD2Z_11010 [Thermoanaerobaculia bacterium]